MAQSYSLPAYDGAVRESTLGGHRATFGAFVVALFMLVLPLGAPAAHAETPSGLAVTLSEVTLSEPSADGTVKISGRVTNRSGTPLHSVNVTLWRSTVLLRSSNIVAAALEAERSPLGKEMSEVPTCVAELTSTGVTMSPGESEAFTVSAKLSEVEIVFPNASYWVGVNASASRTANGKAEVNGRARTLITLPGETTPAVSSVIEISAPPRQVAPDLFMDDDLVSDIAARLDVFADTASQPGYGYVLDPALVAELEDMADGYQVIASKGATQGKGAEAASALLAKLRALPASGYAARFALADPTVGDAEVRAARATQQVGMWLRALPDNSLAAAVQPSKVTLSGTLADQPINNAAVLMAMARVNPQVRLIRTTEDLVVDRLATPSWLERTPLAASANPKPPAEPQVDEKLVAKLNSLAAEMTKYGSAAPDSGASRLVDAQYARGASHWWDTDSSGRSTFLEEVDARLGGGAFGEGITLDVTPRFSMSSSESQFPVTLTNHLADQTVVRLIVTTDSPQRISFAQPEPLTLRHGASQTVTLVAKAESNGVVMARIHVETLDGHRLTPDSSVVVETTNLGRIGWVIVIVSGAVLVVTTARRIRQVRAQQREIRL